MDELLVEERDGGVQFSVRAKPGARRTAIEMKNGVLAVSVVAAPEDGKANAAIITVFAKQLRIAKGAIEIRRGLSSRDKVLFVAGLSRDELLRRFRENGK
ncbi:MAG TPA: DUF167 domain-containing protein [Abditibacteriaceae bacterium]|jgi:hypothetical protein